MTLTTCSSLILICSVFTGLITEGIKTMCKDMQKEYRPNILAGIVSIAVGAFVCIFYAVATKTALNAEYALFCVCLVVLSWLCAMLGYDKVIQTLSQLKK